MKKSEIESVVSVRIVNADYYLANPIPGLDIGYSVYRGEEVKKVPVIRVFGTTSLGYKVCLHIHGVFPYIYVPYDGSSPPEQTGHQIVMAIDKAINIQQRVGSSTVHHVFKASLTSAIPMYGYHKQEHQFFKLYFYNPIMKKHASELLLNGAILNKILQPYEAHIPYVLQFFMDFNLQGMNYVHLKSAFSRRKPFNDENLPPSPADAVSVLDLELDCLAEDIINRLDIEDGIKMNPGLAVLWDEETKRRLSKNMSAENIGPPVSQARSKAAPTHSHLAFKAKLENQLQQVSEEKGDVSLSFAEVNEQLETTLPVETPEEVKDILRGSMIEFHGMTTGKQNKATSSESDGELLDILCELADEHGSVSENNSCIDDDSILGTPHSRPSQSSCSKPNLSHPASSDSDEDQETLVMSQLIWNEDFSEFSKDLEMEAKSDKGLVDLVESDEEQSSCSTLVDDLPALPNLDGANDSSSEDEFSYRPSKKKSKLYKPLAFRKLDRLTTAKRPDPDEVSDDMFSSTTDEESERKHESSEPEPILDQNLDKTTVGSNQHLDFGDVGSTSSNSVKVSATTRKTSESTEYYDALYRMGFPSPEESKIIPSPPVNSSPTETAIVLIRPLLEDVQTYEQSSGKKLELNSARVMLKPIKDEIEDYEKKHRKKLKLPPELKAKKRNYTRLNTILKPKATKTSVKVVHSLPEPIFTSSPFASVPTRCLRSSRIDRLRPDSLCTKSTFVAADNCPSPITSKTIVESFSPSPQYITPVPTGTESPSLISADSPLLISSEPSSAIRENLTPKTLTSVSPGTFIPEVDNACSMTNFKVMGYCTPCFSSSSSSRECNDVPVHVNNDQRTQKEGNEWLAHDSSLTLVNTSVSTSQHSLSPNENCFLPGKCYVPDKDPPGRNRIISTMQTYRIPFSINDTAFWSDPNDEEKGSSKNKYISSRLVRSLEEFGECNSYGSRKESCVMGSVILTPLRNPPSRDAVAKWVKESTVNNLKADRKSFGLTRFEEEKKRKVFKERRSQLEAVTPNNSFGFKVSFGNCQDAKGDHQHQFITIMSLELHISTRQDLRPDPEFDRIEAIFYCISNDVPEETNIPALATGVIAVDIEPLSAAEKKPNLFTRTGIVSIDVTIVENEVTLIEKLISLIRKWNPEIFVGYEIELQSWGYLLQRGAQLGFPMNDLLSRIPTGKERPNFPEDVTEGGYMVEKNSDIAIVGRIVLNLWRLLRSEIAVQSYTFENMAFHILHRRIPTYSFQVLTEWWMSDHHRWQVIEHYITRVRCCLELMEKIDMIGRTSELARLFGIQFYEVFTRGSQFRVESMMLRLAKPQNFIAVSPSVTQRSHMRAPEWLPLILEPESRLYTDPVLVLDFQSLYPSMIIAYNYCFSTCLGRVHHLGRNEPFELGCTQLLVPPHVLKDLVAKDLVNISPAGAVFVKEHVRTGILPQMLDEILNTRIMVKQSMKLYKDDRTLQKVFDSRQLGLKLIANVTYGYTSANFSGRMPCVEVGDSIVSKGRETLERAIRLIEENTKWGARVVYGDTDSVFVLLPGRNRYEAFNIGNEIADLVTQMNPKPVKLKFEKVYQPCILQTKKRYVGYKYETVDQVHPEYEAKGIETVRRDGCPAVVKILERSLRTLFETLDVSQVKSYVLRQWTKIIQDRVSIQDYIFAKEYRGRQGYKPGACVPALELAKQQLVKDRRSEPRIGERVPYVIVYGSPGLPLIRLVVPPNQLLIDPSLRLNAHYYITRILIPPLQRCLGLLGIETLTWYQNLPRINLGIIQAGNNIGRKATISQFFGTSICLLCDEVVIQGDLCSNCLSHPQLAALTLAGMEHMKEKDYVNILTLCGNCAGTRYFGQNCTSIDCPVLYRRIKASHNVDSVTKLLDVLSSLGTK